MKVTVADAQDDTAKQISGIEDLILQKVDILLVNPTDSSAISSAVQSANEAGIPVITIDRSSEEGDIETFIASDNVAGGELAAEYLVKAASISVTKLGAQGGMPTREEVERSFEE